MTDPNFCITTPRLYMSYLDPSNPTHCNFMVSLWNTPEFIAMNNNTPTPITTPSAAKSLIQDRFLSEHRRNGYGTYLISLRSPISDIQDIQAELKASTPIGTVSLMRGESSHILAPDIGFALLSEHMRRGYAVEAASALMEYVSQYQKVKAIFGFCDEGNAASMGALRKLGMKWEGVKEVKEFGKEAAVWSWGMEDVRDFGL